MFIRPLWADRQMSRFRVNWYEVVPDARAAVLTERIRKTAFVIVRDGVVTERRE